MKSEGSHPLYFENSHDILSSNACGRTSGLDAARFNQYSNLIVSLDSRSPAPKMLAKPQEKHGPQHTQRESKKEKVQLPTL